MSLSDLISTIFVALGLATDCFAVALGSGMAGSVITHRNVFRAAIFFGVFQGGMLALGWLAASSIDRYISSIDHWIAVGLLGFVGIKAIWGALRGDGSDDMVDVSRMRNLLLLSVATSIDAMAVGLSLAFAESSLLVTGLLVGGVTFVVAAIGFYVGRRTGSMLGRPAKIFGGLILIGIGLRILIGHLLEGGL